MEARRFLQCVAIICILSIFIYDRDRSASKDKLRQLEAQRQVYAGALKHLGKGREVLSDAKQWTRKALRKLKNLKDGIEDLKKLTDKHTNSEWFKRRIGELKQEAQELADMAKHL